MKERKVELLELEDHLVISPLKKNSFRSVLMGAGTDDEIKQYLLCTYVRGYESADLKSERFTDEQICAARSFMRLLDEKTILDISEERIAYGRSFKVSLESPTIYQMQRLLFEKIQESMRLAGELLEYFDDNPRRTIHLLKMMRTLEEEDVDRMTMQIYRRATRMEIKFDSFADLFFVVLSTDLLEKLGDKIFSIAETICRFYGMEEGRLLFPLEVIIKDIEMKHIPIDQACQEMRRTYLLLMGECESRLREVMDLTLERKGREAYLKMSELNEFNKKLIENLNMTAQEALSLSKGKSSATITRIMEIGQCILEISEMVEELAKEIAMFYFCEELKG